jgi:hypothetical protein
MFQEEALFAPLALGLVLALAGMLLGRAYRQAPVAREFARDPAVPAERVRRRPAARVAWPA